MLLLKKDRNCYLRVVCLWNRKEARMEVTWIVGTMAKKGRCNTKRAVDCG